MSYCTVEDILVMIPESELAELTAESGDEPDLEVVTEAIGKAEAEIDAYLGTVYNVPLSSPSLLIKSLSVDLALYHLYGRRSVAPAVRRQRYEAALALLRAVAEGKAAVPGAEVPGPMTTSASRLFSRESLSDW